MTRAAARPDVTHFRDACEDHTPHRRVVPMTNNGPLNWPRVRDLPLGHQEPFTEWLADQGHTRPWLEGELPQDQDGYYDFDYRRWLATENATS